MPRLHIDRFARAPGARVVSTGRRFKAFAGSIAASRRVRLAIALGSGAALALAFPDAGIAQLAWIAVAPLLLVVRGRRVAEGFLLGFVFGIGFFTVLLYWISIVGYVALVLLVVFQAFFTGLFAAGWALASRRPGRMVQVAAIVVLWVSVEMLRAFVPTFGFTWGQLAQSQHDVPWILRSAAIGGGWLVSGICAALNAFLAEIGMQWGRGRKGAAGAWAAAAGVLLLMPLLIPESRADGDRVRIAIVQGNTARSWTGSFFEEELRIIARHRELTEELDTDPDLVVWPESSVGIDLDRYDFAAESVREAARAVDAPMIVGANIDLPDSRYRVVAFLVGRDGRVIDRYDKTHLVPFGEFVPARRWLEWIPMLDQVPRDAVPAEPPERNFQVAGGEVATAISYEGDFGSLVRSRMAGGARLLVVATNTSTWDLSSASAQHVAMSQLRAAENGVWVVHAALSGISAFISPDGSVVQQTRLFTPGTITRDVRWARQTTFYARTGDWFPVGCGVAAMVLLLWSARAKRPDADTVPA